MNENELEEFNRIAQKYVDALRQMYTFIEENGLDNDQVWDKANQLFDKEAWT